MVRLACALTLAVILTAANTAQASGPVGGYVIVDKVVLTPAEDPTTIQIWGSFVLATSEKTYGKPERGYLYYKAAPGTEALCRKEWADLKRSAGTAQVIGFGSTQAWEAMGKVRKANKKAENPIDYPFQNGLVRLAANSGDRSVRALLALPAPQTPAEGVLVPPGTITLVTRNIADKNHAKAKYVFELRGASGDKEEATVEAGEKETKWTPTLKLKAGEKYTWSVRAVEGDWKGPPATSRFVVKGEK